MEEQEKKWCDPDKKGVIHVPDELDPLINSIAFQHKLHTISQHFCENEMYARMVYSSEKFFNKLIKEKIKEKIKELDKYDIYGGREGLTDREKSKDGQYIDVEELFKKIFDDHKL